MEIKRIAKKTFPLCFLPDGRLLTYHQGKAIMMRDGKVEGVYPLPISRKERLLGWSNIVSRLLRFGVRAALPYDDTHVILNIGNRLVELDTVTCSLTTGWKCDDGIRPLVMNNINGIDGFLDGAYFGGYVHNHEMKPVSIYRRKAVDEWEVVYTFPNGTINHVHNVIADPFRECLWIFTGDFGDAAAIWKVTEGFRKVEKIAGGDQCWRGSSVFVLPEGLLYATDTPRANDYLYLFNPVTMEQKKVMSLDGSCIYGCQWKDKYVLSTTVESNGGDMSFWENWFGRKRGDGIKDEYVHMYCGNLKDGFREIYKEKKDWLPFTLFQFGVFKFPTGVNNIDTLYYQPIATSKDDLALMAIKE